MPYIHASPRRHRPFDMDGRTRSSALPYLSCDGRINSATTQQHSTREIPIVFSTRNSKYAEVQVHFLPIVYELIQSIDLVIPLMTRPAAWRRRPAQVKQRHAASSINMAAAVRTFHGSIVLDSRQAYSAKSHVAGPLRKCWSSS